MKRLNILRKASKALVLLAITVGGVGWGSMLTSCSDEPDTEHFYTFTGEMLSDYLNNRPYYSEFKTIVERANLMDLLATYGQYTCFLPSNEAIDTYLHERGLQSIDQLTDADCDTIARTHLVANMYSTFEMNQDRLITANLLGRYLATSQGVDNDSNAVVYLEGTAHIIFEQRLPDGSLVHQNDSVENGIVQRINMVIAKSNSYIADIRRENPNITILSFPLRIPLTTRTSQSTTISHTHGMRWLGCPARGNMALRFSSSPTPSIRQSSRSMVSPQPTAICALCTTWPVRSTIPCIQMT